MIAVDSRTSVNWLKTEQTKFSWNSQFNQNWLEFMRNRIFFFTLHSFSQKNSTISYLEHSLKWQTLSRLMNYPLSRNTWYRPLYRPVDIKTHTKIYIYFIYRPFDPQSKCPLCHFNVKWNLINLNQTPMGLFYFLIFTHWLFIHFI